MGRRQKAESSERYVSFELDSYSADPKVEPQLNAKMDELDLDDDQKNFIWGVIMFGPRYIISLLQGIMLFDNTDSDGGKITIINDNSVRDSSWDK